jgi:hypothetical protein
MIMAKSNGMDQKNGDQNDVSLTKEMTGESQI